MDTIESIKITEKAQLSIPKAIREKLKIKPGDNLIMFTDGDEIILKKSDDLVSLLRKARKVKR